MNDAPPCFIRSKHPDSYRSGQWARIDGVVWSKTMDPSLDGASYQVSFVDGHTDQWPINDPVADYEFSDAVTA